MKILDESIILGSHHIDALKWDGENELVICRSSETTGMHWTECTTYYKYTLSPSLQIRKEEISFPEFKNLATANYPLPSVNAYTGGDIQGTSCNYYKTKYNVILKESLINCVIRRFAIKRRFGCNSVRNPCLPGIMHSFSCEGTTYSFPPIFVSKKYLDSIMEPDWNKYVYEGNIIFKFDFKSRIKIG